MLCSRLPIAAWLASAKHADPRQRDGVGVVCILLAGSSYRPDDSARPAGYRADSLRRCDRTNHNDRTSAILAFDLCRSAAERLTAALGKLGPQSNVSAC